MTQPLGMDDFFALEAGEYLERLAALLAAPTLPRPEELVRFVRALRGSALMANQHAIARAAGGLEQVVRAYRDGRREWDSATGNLAALAVQELRALVLKVRTWTPEDTARAERLATKLEGTTGPIQPPTPASPASDAGVRAFLAREAAAVASALDQASRSLQGTESQEEVIQAVRRRMQPLRGLAALSDFPPLAEVLDGVERAAAAADWGSSRAQLGELFDAGAQALGRSARDVADRGKPDPEAPECRRFVEVLLALEPRTEAVVPIETLFFDGEPGLVVRGAAPAPSDEPVLAQAELVSRGEHLCQVADELDRAPSPTTRSLRLHSLVADLRALGANLGSPELERSLDSFGLAGRMAISRGIAVKNYGRLVATLREAGNLLRAAGERGMLAEMTAGLVRLGGVIESLAVTDPVESAVATTAPTMQAEPMAPESAPGSAESAPKLEPQPSSGGIAPLAPVPPTDWDDLDYGHAAPPGAGEEIVPIESLAPDEEGVVVPIESLAPDQEGVVVPIESLAPDDEPRFAQPGAGLIGAFVTYQRLLALHGTGEASIEVLLGRVVSPSPTVVPEPAHPPTSVLAETVERPVPVLAPEPDVVAIADICYRGRSALQRAADVRHAIRHAMASHAPGAVLRPLVEELLDLVDLAMVD